MAGPLDETLDAVRRRVALSLRGAVGGSRNGPPQFELADATDPGLFGPDSVAWRIHRDTSMFVGGLRALLLQTSHPLAMAGVAEHSDYRSDPWGRLRRTALYVGTTTYGSTEAAERVIGRVRAVHSRVRGVAPDGRPYDATDPHLLAWVHATEVDSFLRAYRRYGSDPIASADADRYVAEMAVVAERIGAEAPPTDVAGLREVLVDFRPELMATRQAHDAVRFLLLPPVPLATRGPYGLIAAAAVGLLPTFLRRMLWLPQAPLSDPLVVRPATRVLMSSLGWALAIDEPPSAASA
jgi:uncharacterized protein (DUF2236 family)